MLTYEPSRRISAKAAIADIYFADVEVCIPPRLWIHCFILWGLHRLGGLDWLSSIIDLAQNTKHVTYYVSVSNSNCYSLVQTALHRTVAY